MEERKGGSRRRWRQRRPGISSGRKVTGPLVCLEAEKFSGSLIARNRRGRRGSTTPHPFFVVRKGFSLTAGLRLSLPGLFHVHQNENEVVSAGQGATHRSEGDWLPHETARSRLTTRCSGPPPLAAKLNHANLADHAPYPASRRLHPGSPVPPAGGAPRAVTCGGTAERGVVRQREPARRERAPVICRGAARRLERRVDLQSVRSERSGSDRSRGRCEGFGR